MTVDHECFLMTLRLRPDYYTANVGVRRGNMAAPHGLECRVGRASWIWRISRCNTWCQIMQMCGEAVKARVSASRTGGGCCAGKMLTFSR